MDTELRITIPEELVERLTAINSNLSFLVQESLTVFLALTEAYNRGAKVWIEENGNSQEIFVGSTTNKVSEAAQ